MIEHRVSDKVVDIEMTKRCADAMGIGVSPQTTGRWYVTEGWYPYEPLVDDAQAMALVKRFKLNIGQLHGGAKVFTGFQKMPFVEADSPDLNRAIVECVAKMQADTGAGERKG